MNIVIDDRYGWHYVEEADLRYWYQGSPQAAKRWVDRCRELPGVSPEDLERGALENEGCYAVIIEGQGRVVAAVDRIRSYPVFYVRSKEGFCISNSARALRVRCGLSEVDDLSLIEFQMAGYVTGRETLFRDLYQMQAGEFLIWDEEGAELQRRRYYVFYSEALRTEGEDQLLEEHAEITNRVFRQVIDQADGARIWVALSGGLDSRLVLCKLKELGYDNLQAFSYGTRGNYEAKAAEAVAEKVGVPWRFVPISMGEARAFFRSAARERYWDFADGLSNVPNMQDIHALHKLLQKKIMAAGDFVVNGQSGDFTTGGHIPSSFITERGDMDLLFGRAFEKHYAQWLPLMTPERFNRLKRKIAELLGIDEREKAEGQRLAGLYEWWEWQERQCKYVINGQRIYDFLNLRWFLPLWHDAYLDFWSRIPLALKYGQALYRKYLERFDLYRCFRGFHPQVWRWPGMSIAVVPAARALGLLCGRKYMDLFYQYCMYIGHYRNAYAPHGFFHFLGRARLIRGPVSLDIERWLSENLGFSRLATDKG